VVPDLGAFPERIRNRPLTWVEPWQRPASEWVDFFSGIATELDERPERPLAWKDQPKMPVDGDFYRNSYLMAVTPSVVTTPLDEHLLERVVSRSKQLRDHEKQRLFREAMLRHLLLLRQGPFGRMLSRMVPVQIQRRIKRTLSRKPVHELGK